MKFNIEKIGNWRLEISNLSDKDNPKSTEQLFLGPTARGFEEVVGYYENARNTWPPVSSWENQYIEKFIDNQDPFFPGGYIFWVISRLAILTPKTKESGCGVYKDKRVVEFCENLKTDYYSITINLERTECDDVDKIVFEITKALENFDLDVVFNEIVQCYRTTMNISDESSFFKELFSPNKEKTSLKKFEKHFKEMRDKLILRLS